MEKPKEYHINSFERLLNLVTKENVDDLSVDIYQWLRAYSHLVESIRKEKPEIYEDKLNWDICASDFNWIDDGKTDFKGFKTVVKETGEEVYIEAVKLK